MIERSRIKSPGKELLVGGFNPFEQYYCSQSGSFPQVGVNIQKQKWNHHLGIIWNQDSMNSNMIILDVERLRQWQCYRRGFNMIVKFQVLF